MKTLELNQMESVQGGMNQRNCGLMGLGIIAGLYACCFPGGAPYGVMAIIGFTSAAATGDCF